MAESLFKRIKRIASGRVEDMVDDMEKSGGSRVMREAVRELDRVLDDVKAERNEMTARRLQAVRQQQMYAERLEAIEEKARFAIDQNREDLAEAALHRQMDFESQKEKLKEVEKDCSEKERALEESLASLEMRKAYLEEELKHFEAAQNEAGLSDSPSNSAAQNKLKKVERAEAAFNRAMTGAGGTNNIADAKNTSLIAEIDTIKRQSEIATRMDALRRKEKVS